MRRAVVALLAFLACSRSDGPSTTLEAGASAANAKSAPARVEDAAAEPSFFVLVSFSVNPIAAGQATFLSVTVAGRDSAKGMVHVRVEQTSPECGVVEAKRTWNAARPKELLPATSTKTALSFEAAVRAHDGVEHVVSLVGRQRGECFIAVRAVAGGGDQVAEAVLTVR